MKPKSTPGTSSCSSKSYTNGNVFNVTEIREILNSCRESGVTQLKIGDLEVSFLPLEKKNPQVATPEEQKKAKEFENDAFKENERRVKMEQLSQLRISDPETYEELISEGELENAGEESKGIDA